MCGCRNHHNMLALCTCNCPEHTKSAKSSRPVASVISDDTIWIRVPNHLIRR